ncbi:MAG: sigma-54-dependent Fis family transcriptional regulator [Deltaproteobacteria bacterium]|nr:sigma-54-dependent Fis family transcriptional regulator [Deltaproteobacteria bacterium]
MGNSIIIIDDERDFLESVRRGLITAGFRNIRVEKDPLLFASGFQDGTSFDLALIDVTMPGMNGVELLEFIKKHSPDTECVMVSALNEARVAVDCLKKGAYDYLVKPVSREDLIIVIERALERKRLLEILNLDKKGPPLRLIHEEAFRPILTQSPRIIRVLKEAELHAASNVPILITGESGTGKELLARAIHEISPRARAPFTAVNMASQSSTLFDAEFFGHTRGAFTGAGEDRAGYIEHTHRGTLFLDEIGNLPLELQGKLLRVLQEGEYMKLGKSSAQKADLRFIAATNMNLDRLMQKGEFRKDLYYRLKGAWLELPPLRERKEDIPLLIERFLQEFSPGKRKKEMDAQALEMLLEYGYPGNIRELRSIIQSAANLSSGRMITPDALPEQLHKKTSPSTFRIHGRLQVVQSLSELEREHIFRVYEQTGKNKSMTARLLGIGLNTLRRKLEAYGVA